MKLFFLAFLALLSLNALAANICDLSDTNEFEALVNKRQIVLYQRSANHFRFSHLEKGMIHLTVQRLEGRRITTAQALKVFGDFNEYTNGQPGSLAGEILYYTTKANFRFAFVRYWPGDNEYGAFVTMVNNQLKLFAIVGDGEIRCVP